MTNTNISVIDEYHRSLISSQPFATIFPIGVPPVEAAEEVEDDEATAKVVRRPKTAKTSATEEGVETK